MSDLGILKKQYEDQINERLKTNLGVLTDTIVESFGEQHKDTITQRIQELNILFYMNANTVESAIKSGKLSEYEINYYSLLLKEIKTNKLVISSDPEENRRNNLNSRVRRLFQIVGNGQLTKYLNDNFLDAVAGNERVTNAINGNKNISLLKFAEDETRYHSLMVLPFLRVSDKTLIHEIIHLLGFNEKKVDLSKSGIVVPSSYTDNRVRKGIEDIDENYVERKAVEISRRLQEKGVSILPQAVFHEYSLYSNINGTLDGLFSRYDSLFSSATFTSSKDVLKETLGDELLSRIGLEVFQLGSGSGYVLLPGQSQKETSDKFCEEVSRKVDR